MKFSRFRKQARVVEDAEVQSEKNPRAINITKW